MTWSYLPDMKHAHAQGPACGVVKNGAKRSVVVAGGAGGVQKVEILDLDTLQWSDGTGKLGFRK